MDKPTQGQERRVWEWLGWEYKVTPDFEGYVLDKPNQPVQVKRQLAIDFNTLIKYTFPKLKESKLHIQFTVDFEMPDFGKPALYYWSILKGSHRLLAVTEGDDFALGLFWTIYKAIEELEK